MSPTIELRWVVQDGEGGEVARFGNRPEANLPESTELMRYCNPPPSPSSSVFASFRSAVSKPSVNQL